MDVKQFILDTIEDLATLEVATLTNKAEIPLDLTDKIVEDPDGNLKSAQKKVDNSKKELLKLLNESAERDKIRKKKVALKTAEKQLDEIKRTMGIYDPKDIFSKIRSQLNEGELVAYSRFEIEGDSINYVSSLDYVKELIKEHKNMVAASQEARKALFDTAIKAVSAVIPG